MSIFYFYRSSQFKVIFPGLYTPNKKATPKSFYASDAASQHASKFNVITMTIQVGVA